MWLVDTGASFHVVGRKELRRGIRRLSRPADIPVEVDTATGKVKLDHVVPPRLQELGLDISPFLISQSPAVLSIGRLCMEQKFSFSWKPGRAPTLTGPNLS